MRNERERERDTVCVYRFKIEGERKIKRRKKGRDEGSEGGRKGRTDTKKGGE